MMIPVRLKKCEVDLLTKLVGKIEGASRSSVLRAGLLVLGRSVLKKEKALLDRVASLQRNSWSRYGSE